MLDNHPDKDFAYFTQDRTPLLELCSSANGRVLEIGCGFGLLLVEAKRRGAEWVCGIEVDPDAFEKASGHKEIDQMLRLDFERGKVLPFPPDHFNIVIASHV